jgi:hypothetical protein
MWSSEPNDQLYIIHRFRKEHDGEEKLGIRPGTDYPEIQSPRQKPRAPAHGESFYPCTTASVRPSKDRSLRFVSAALPLGSREFRRLESLSLRFRCTLPVSFGPMLGALKTIYFASLDWFSVGLVAALT